MRFYSTCLYTRLSGLKESRCDSRSLSLPRRLCSWTPADARFLCHPLSRWLLPVPRLLASFLSQVPLQLPHLCLRQQLHFLLQRRAAAPDAMLRYGTRRRSHRTGEMVHRRLRRSVPVTCRRPCSSPREQSFSAFASSSWFSSSTSSPTRILVFSDAGRRLGLRLPSSLAADLIVSRRRHLR